MRDFIKKRLKIFTRIIRNTKIKKEHMMIMFCLKKIGYIQNQMLIR